MSTDKRIGFVLLSFGTLGTLLSILYDSTILAFPALTLVFWGCLFILVLPGKYVKSEVFDHMSRSSLAAINQIIAESGLAGKPMYVPVPKGFYLPYQVGLRNEFVYIPETDVDIETAIEQAFSRTPRGLRVTPPGLALADLVEKRSRLSFSDTSLNSLVEVLPPVVTQDLEIATDFRIRVEGNMIRVEIEKPVCEDLCREASKMEKIWPSIGDPLNSSIACAITRVTNKPVLIERCFMKSSSIETHYRIL